MGKFSRFTVFSADQLRRWAPHFKSIQDEGEGGGGSKKAPLPVFPL